MTHSPLPWRTKLHKIEPPRLVDALGAGVADEQEYGSCVIEPDDQALIVRAVNAHDALVAALEEMVRRCDINPTADYHLRARAALTLARGGA